MYPIQKQHSDWIIHDSAVESRVPQSISLQRSGVGLAGAHPSGLGVKAGSEPGQVASLSQGQRREQVRSDTHEILRPAFTSHSLLQGQRA